jgi:hypothetical protein
MPSSICARALAKWHKGSPGGHPYAGDEENDACGDLLNAPRRRGFSLDERIHLLNAPRRRGFTCDARIHG